MKGHELGTGTAAKRGHCDSIAEQLTILVDVEERRSSVPDCLRALGVAVELAPVPVGDYVLAPRIAVERKTIHDLHKAIASGRIWSQVAAMSHELDHAYLLVEGMRLDSVSGVSARGVRGALLRILDGRVRVIRTDGPNDSALWLRLMAVRVGRSSGIDRRRGRRRTVTTPAGILATVPGVSPRTARLLIERFGSVAGVAAAEKSELQEITGVGAVRANALASALRGEPK